MPQLDLYIWPVVLLFFVFIFIIFYFVFVYFFLFKIVKTLYVRKYFKNYLSSLIKKFNFKNEKVNAGVVSSKFSLQLGRCNELLLKFLKIVDVYILYNVNFLFEYELYNPLICYKELKVYKEFLVEFFEYCDLLYVKFFYFKFLVKK